ncbi:MAG: DNA polymerase III subunit gamma/tau [Candidatus Saccharimonadales bacterium]
MAQVLYRKYRSKQLSEIVGQEHITKTLSNALKSGRISHAYLFTGPRGVGKTSVARILAHEVNKIPYNDDTPHIDIIEIDAASNRRIDEIRDLREKVHISPASATYKVYIIDEVHMLTKEAFNALLKTLEEPPAHVIFILATTDPHKLPDTIISRTQRFSFKPIDKHHAVEHLRSIADSEHIKITSKALQLIADHGEGSFRDSISLLDQLAHGSREITDEDVRQMLGIPSSEVIDKLTTLVDSKTTTYKELSDQLNEVFDLGYDPNLLAKRLMNELRNKLVDNQLQMPPSTAMSLLKELLNVSAASDPSTYLLLTLLSVLPNDSGSSYADKTTTDTAEHQEPAPPYITPKTQSSTNRPKLELSDEIWPAVLNELKNKYNTLYAIVRMAQPVFKDNQLDLIFDFAFHKKQVSEAKNKKILSDIISQISGKDYKIETHLNDSGQPIDKNLISKNAGSKDLDNISKIFGGGELVD